VTRCYAKPEGCSLCKNVPLARNLLSKIGHNRDSLVSQGTNRNNNHNLCSRHTWVPEAAQLLKKGSLLWKRVREESSGGGGGARGVEAPFPRKLGRVEPAIKISHREEINPTFLLHLLPLAQQGMHNLRRAVERAVRRLCRHEEASILLLNWSHHSKLKFPDNCSSWSRSDIVRKMAGKMTVDLWDAILAAHVFFLDLPRDANHSMARFRLCVHTLHLITATWNSTSESSPTSELCEADIVQDIKTYSFLHAPPYGFSPQEVRTARMQYKLHFLMNLFYFMNRWAVILLYWRPFPCNPWRSIESTCKKWRHLCGDVNVTTSVYQVLRGCQICNWRYSTHSENC